MTLNIKWLDEGEVCGMEYDFRDFSKKKLQPDASEMV